MISDLEILAEIENNGVLDEMLIAGGEIICEAQKYKVVNWGLKKTGQLQKSITLSKPRKIKNGKEISIYFKGSQKRTYKHGYRKGQTYRVKNSEIAFILEFGQPKRGIPAYPFIMTANTASADAAINAAEEIYDQWLGSI